ncbi:Ech1 [Symbiodinium sp. KB8]|nr:Ech1 [Symbiodinium sp. KB8]
MAANRLEPFSRLTRLAVTEAAPHVLHVELQRPQKLNALDMAFWEEIRTCFEAIALDVDTRVVLLSGAGRCFCAGLDLGAAMAMFGGSSGAGQAESDVARKALRVRAMGKAWQASFTSLEACGKAVIGCMHGAVVGAGLEMITACDVRFCTEDAYFQAAEVDVGLAADVGGLQRLPKIIGNQSLVRELALSGRRMAAAEVKAQGYRFDHEGEFPLITVFSAPNYAPFLKGMQGPDRHLRRTRAELAEASKPSHVDKAGNMASVAVLTNDGLSAFLNSGFMLSSKLTGPEFVQYSAQPHPDVPSGAYAVGGPLHPQGAAR